MNLRDPKNQIRIFVVILFLAVFYLWFTKIFESYEGQIRDLTLQSNTLLEKVHAVRSKAATLEELTKEYNARLLVYKQMELLLPEIKEDETLLSQLHAAAQLTNSVIRKVTPLGSQASEFYETNNYSVEVQSSFHGIGRFFAKIGNFPFIVNLSALELKSPTITGGGAVLGSAAQLESEETVVATFKLSTYNVKQGES